MKRCSLIFTTLVAMLAATASMGGIPQRIIPLQPSLAELIVAIGVPAEKIVGVVEYTDFPAELRTRPSVGSYDKPNLEKIFALKPDLVLLSKGSSPSDLFKKLERTGIRVEEVSIQNLNELYQSITKLGAIFSLEKPAAKLKLKIESELSQIENFYRNKPLVGKRILIQVGDQPLVVAGKGSILDDAVTLLGLENVYRDMERPYARISREDAVKKNPDVLILLGMSESSENEKKMIQAWSLYQNVTAVQQGRVKFIRSDALLRAGPRFPSGLATLAAAAFGVGYEIKNDRK